MIHEQVYTYRDEAGEVLFEVVRGPDKTFAQRQPGPMGSWTWNLDGVRKVPYHLPALVGRPAVWIVEGEKDAERLWSLGIPATTNPGGAGKWADSYSADIAAMGVLGVIVCPDNDTVGRVHAARVANSCLRAGLQVKMVDLAAVSTVPPKGDVSDWLDAGGRPEQLSYFARLAESLTDQGDELPPTRTGHRSPLSSLDKAVAVALYRERLKIPAAVQGSVLLMCPFHPDATTASFSLDLDNGVFYCHGACTEPKGGGPIRFLLKWAERERQYMTFRDAERELRTRRNQKCREDNADAEQQVHLTHPVQRTPLRP